MKGQSDKNNEKGVNINDIEVECVHIFRSNISSVPEKYKSIHYTCPTGEKNKVENDKKSTEILISNIVESCVEYFKRVSNPLKHHPTFFNREQLDYFDKIIKNWKNKQDEKVN